MGIFSALFGKKSEKPPKSNLTPEQFLQETLVIETAREVKRNAVLLHPQRAKAPLGAEVSKFGGQPNMSGFTEWPHCYNCKGPMNFALQLYRRDLPDAWFPIGKDLMQVWRCRNSQCQAAADHYDIPTFLYFFEDKGPESSSGRLEMPVIPKRRGEDLEVIHECSLSPERIEDYPDNGEDFYQKLDAEYGYRLMEVWSDAFPSTEGTKVLGWPSWIQYPEYPNCKCGHKMDFIFQLGSEEYFKSGRNIDAPHGIMMGDGGSMYFFVCLLCGEDSVESRWDCY